MKLFNILIIILLCESRYSYSQVDLYKENTWFSLVWKHSISEKWNVTADVGYRLFDSFLNKRRQDLVRVLVERKIKNNQSLGLGFAYFESIVTNTDTYNTEFRPFLQYQFQYTNGKSKLGVRFRNELRYYKNANTYVDRARLQVAYDFVLNEQYLNPRLAVEEFVSFQNKPLIEQRYSVGNTINWSEKWSMYLFYTVQLQSNIVQYGKPLPQHIIGLQMLLNTP